MSRKLFHILVAALVSAGCSTASVENAVEVGWLVVNHSFADESTKAGSTDISDYSVTISGTSHEYSFESSFGELPSVLELIPGEYNIHVCSPGTASAAFDNPVYSHSQDFTIKANETSSVTMLLSNVAVTLVSSSTFNRDTVASCTVTVSDGQAELVWTLDDVINERTGYFVGSSMLFVCLEGVAVNGSALSYNEVFHDVEAPANYRITFGEYVPTI